MKEKILSCRDCKFLKYLKSLYVCTKYKGTVNLTDQICHQFEERKK